MSLILWIKSRLLHLQTPEGSGSGGRIPEGSGGFLSHLNFRPYGSGGSSPTLTSDLKVWGFSPTGLGVSGVHMSLIQTNNGC
jgi:hypothetical protein